VITSGNYNNPSNWSTGVVPTGPSTNANYTGPYATWYDIGGYGNATPANGQLGQYGRTPATNQVDMHLDYTIKASAKLRVIPSVDIFNLFNTRYPVLVNDQGTGQSGSANPSFGQATAWQEGRNFRFGVKVQF
jgi:hypothetical protein